MINYLSNKKNIISYISLSLLISLISSISIFLILNIIFPAEDIGKSFEGNFTELIIILGFLTPLVETLLLLIGILFINRFSKNIHLTSAISAVIWAGMHSYVSPVWGVVTFLPFYIFSLAFLVWKENSILCGFFVSFIIHSLQNNFAVFLMVLE
ncbi:hypothetical protein [Pseudoalteromonas piratica]|uniref:hypothetical protein n=1 Tax=Pseudoalteromonas piratica TaxID=1348114 RepID=UPI001F47F258|nr:hypothetical protein [Pseudoalteromonas piratica]